MIHHYIIMNTKRVILFEMGLGLAFIVLDYLVWWWSINLLWILIHPPPLAKQVISSLPCICWSLSAFLFLDSLRRTIKDRTV
jgi:hypothetical protein